MNKSIIGIIFLFLACGSPNSQTNESEDETSQILSDLIAAHGELNDYRFVFREHEYSFAFDDENFVFTKKQINDSLIIIDTLTNDSFKRFENGVQLDLSVEDIDRYSESLNSVIYFVCLPFKLLDEGAIKKLVGETVIRGKNYHVLSVTFSEEGGGKDHEDIFYYWINKNTHIMDYMAYKYNTNEGGVRFREAFNSRMVDGMRFQDYINYASEVNTELDSLPALFERGALEEASRILTEQVVRLN